MRMHLVGLGVVVVTMLMTPAGRIAAQDVFGEPYSGTVDYVSGVTSDPRIVDTVAGGDIDLGLTPLGCSGFITNDPDVRVSYTAGSSSLPLLFSVESVADTMLLVNAPDGSWYCDDDGGNSGLNPVLKFDPPRSGDYDIWIGLHEAGAVEEADLYISETGLV